MDNFLSHLRKSECNNHSYVNFVQINIFSISVNLLYTRQLVKITYYFHVSQNSKSNESKELYIHIFQSIMKSSLQELHMSNNYVRCQLKIYGNNFLITDACCQGVAVNISYKIYNVSKNVLNLL